MKIYSITPICFSARPNIKAEKTITREEFYKNIEKFLKNPKNEQTYLKKFIKSDKNYYKNNLANFAEKNYIDDLLMSIDINGGIKNISKDYLIYKMEQLTNIILNHTK